MRHRLTTQLYTIESILNAVATMFYYRTYIGLLYQPDLDHNLYNSCRKIVDVIMEQRIDIKFHGKTATESF